MPAPAPAAWVVAGRVRHAHGVRGLLRVELEAEAEVLAGLTALRLQRPDGTAETFGVASLRPVHRGVLLGLVGLDGRDAAQAWHNSEVLARRDQVPPAAAGEFYFFELIGLQACDAAGRALGRVAGVADNRGQALLQIEAADGSERLLPVAAGTVVRLDRAAGAVRLQVPDGLWTD